MTTNNLVDTIAIILIVASLGFASVANYQSTVSHIEAHEISIEELSNDN